MHQDTETTCNQPSSAQSGRAAEAAAREGGGARAREGGGAAAVGCSYGPRWGALRRVPVGGFLAALLLQVRGC